MFANAGLWLDQKFITFRNWLDSRLVPHWRIWWKLASMRLGIIAAAIVTFLTAVPQALSQAMDDLPDWLRHSLPTWIGPVMLGALFFARFWDQTKTTAAAKAQEIRHGAE